MSSMFLYSEDIILIHLMFFQLNL
ncbi:hypothetical protein MTR67_038995 [Solanum verrucosum]|uniref:Uncharacterized protein n=1 Tax=Solanum verrucosum TaxID=315347 RepID=A0AAF0UG49_SOLVR|nr:hypothetical protein MTR67_038995 [Solanum verrucosum]